MLNFNKVLYILIPISLVISKIFLLYDHNRLYFKNFQKILYFYYIYNEVELILVILQLTNFYYLHL